MNQTSYGREGVYSEHLYARGPSRTFISYNVMRCPTEAEVRKCSGHKSMKIFERYITFDED